MKVGWYVKHSMFPESVYIVTSLRFSLNNERILSVSVDDLTEGENDIEFGLVDEITRCNPDGTPYVEPPVAQAEVVAGSKVRYIRDPGDYSAAFQLTKFHVYEVQEVYDCNGAIFYVIDGVMYISDRFDLVLDYEPEVVEEKIKHTIERFVVVFYNNRLQKISTEFKNTEVQFQDFLNSLERHGHTILKKSKPKFEVEVPEGVRVE